MKSESIHTAILGAMEAEVAECLRHGTLLSQDFWADFIIYHLNLFGHRCIMVRCGIGKVFAAMVTQRLIDLYQPRQIVFTGVAGALNPNLNIGDVVVSRDLLQHDVDGRALGFKRGQLLYTDHHLFTADPLLVQKAMKANLEGHAIVEGRVLTGDQFMNREEVDKHEHLTGEMKGDVVEMEGAAVAQVCALNQVPFVVVRTVSDRADGQAVHDFNAFLPIIAQNSFKVLKAILTED